MYIYLSSTHSPDINPANTAAKFTVQLPRTFSSNDNASVRGRWYLGLLEITLPPISSSSHKWDILYVLCPDVEGAVIGSTYSPILRSIALGEIRRHHYARFESVLYLPLRVADLANISIELSNSAGEVFPDLAEETKHSTHCTLELIWR